MTHPTPQIAAPAGPPEAWLASFPAGEPALVVLGAPGSPPWPLAAALAAAHPTYPVLAVDAGAPPAGERGYAAVAWPGGAGGALLQALAALAGRRDLVLLAADAALPAGWLPALRRAAASASTALLAAPICAGPGFRAAPGMPALVAERPLDAAALDSAAAALPAAHPPLLWAPAGCTYVRRLALDVLGPPDPALPFPDGAELDLWLRACARGLSGALAADLVVARGGAGAATPLPAATLAALRARHHWLGAWLAGAERAPAAPLADALGRARAALGTLQIALDATSVSDGTTGTQVLAAELLRALRAQLPPGVALTAIVADGAGEPVRALLGRYAHALTTPAALRAPGGPRFDLVHRPFQVYTPGDLELLRACGRRLVVSYLDFINYTSPLIFRTPEDALAYRLLTARVYAAADGVAYISADAAGDAERNGFALPPERVCVTGMGVDHQIPAAVAPEPPPLREALGGAPFLLLVANGFAHKYRPFALLLLRALRDAYRWPGHLVLAGAPDPLPVPEELAGRVHQPGVVNEAHKRWLMASAALVIMPSLAEGFGLTPFEAAALGTPAIASRQASLTEVLGDEVRSFESFDPDEAAAAAWPLLSDPAAAARQVALIRARAAEHTWERAAAATWAFYRRVLDLPPRPRDDVAASAEALRLQEGLSAELLGYRAVMASRTLGSFTRAVIAAHAGARRLKDGVLARARGRR